LKKEHSYTSGPWWPVLGQTLPLQLPLPPFFDLLFHQSFDWLAAFHLELLQAILSIAV